MASVSASPHIKPDRNCPLCPRLAEFRKAARKREPDWFNSPVDSFGDATAQLLIVGLAPGMQGANRTGRPFTGDYAGDLLYSTLLQFGFARGRYDARADDGFELVDCIISNSVRCVPPQNKPTPQEISTCCGFLRSRMTALPNVRIMVALGRIAHDSALTALGCRKSQYPFAHAARHELPGGVRLIDSFHCSRYNTNTRRLTEEMFHAVFADARNFLATTPAKSQRH